MRQYGRSRNPELSRHSREAIAIGVAALAMSACVDPQDDCFIEPFEITNGPSGTVLVGTLVQLEGIWPNTWNGEPVSASWAMSQEPAGSQIVFDVSSPRMPTFTPLFEGDYLVRLTGGAPRPGGTGNNCRGADLISVTAGLIVADAGSDQRVDVGTQVTLDGSNSQGNVQTYEWTRIHSYLPLQTMAPPNHNSAGFTFTFDEPDSLQYELKVTDGTPLEHTNKVVVRSNPPTISNLTPNSGPVGTRVVITGTNFSPTDNLNEVSFGGIIAPVISASSTQIEVDVPSGATTGLGVRTVTTGDLVTSGFTITTQWNHVNTSLAVGLNGVSTPDANTAFVVGDNGTIVSTVDAGMTWSAPHTTNTTVNLFDVVFTSLVDGIAVGGNGTILRTTDGGATPWATSPSGVTFNITGVSFINTTTGWAAVNAPAGNTPLLRTTNGGTAWTQVTPPGITFFCCTAVSFAPNSMVGIAVGFGSEVLRTVDGGANWTLASLPLTATLADVAMVDAQTGWAVGETASPRRPLVLKTANGGATWSNQTANLPANIAALTIGMASVHGVNPMHATIAGQGSMILRTADGGATWFDEGTLPPPNNWNDVSFPPNNTVDGIAVAPGAIARRQ